MWDMIIKKELNKTIINLNTNSIQKSEARTKLNNLIKLTRTNVQKGHKRELKNNIFKVKRDLKFKVMVQPSIEKKPNNSKMGFTNIGNFGKKISEFNAQRREKNMEKLRMKAQTAEVENKKLEEEMVLRKSLEKNAGLKKQVKEQKLAKVKGVIEKLNKAGNKFEDKSKNKFNILGNQNSKKKCLNCLEMGIIQNLNFKFLIFKPCMCYI